MSTTRKIAFSAIAAALLVVSKFCLSAIAGIEVVTLLIFVFAFSLGLVPTLFSVCVMILIDIAYYGFAPWVLMYVLHFPLLSVVAWLCRKVKANELVTAAVAFVMTWLFAMQSTLIESLAYGYPFNVRFVSGVVVFAVNAASNFVMVLLLVKPLSKAIGLVVSKE